MASNESLIMTFPDPFVKSMFWKESFPQFSLFFSLERWFSAVSLVSAFSMIFLHEFAPLFFAAVPRSTEAAEGDRISSRADSISLRVSRLKKHVRSHLLNCCHLPELPCSLLKEWSLRARD